jgi:hypothetical protein
MKELLFSITKKDFKIETFKAGGKGGQHQNKTDSGVRIKHPESGSAAECRNNRSQLQNKKEAFRRLIETPKFKSWFKITASALLIGETIEEKVEKQMAPENIKTEVRKDNKWVNDHEIK